MVGRETLNLTTWVRSLHPLPIWIVTPRQNAEIVKMISEGIITKKTALEVLEVCIKTNLDDLNNALPPARK